MGEQGLICGWHDKYRSLWGHQPIRLGHRLHKLDLFGTDGLASLIEGYPREHFSIVQTSDSTQRRLWREGELGGLSGREVIEAIGRRAQIVSLANGLLRHRFGWQPRSRSIEGPSYWAKPFLQPTQQLLDTTAAACAQSGEIPARPRRPRRGGQSDHVMGLELFRSD